MAGPEEKIIALPSELFSRWCGYSFDIGGSCMKIAYIKEEDYHKYKENGDATIPVRFVNFSRPEIESAMEYIKQYAYITPGTTSEGLPVTYTTGVGTFQFMKMLNEKLGVKHNNLNELDCVGDGLRHLLENLSARAAFVPLDTYRGSMELPIAELTKMVPTFIQMANSEKSNYKFNDEGALELMKSDDIAGCLKDKLTAFLAAWADPGDPETPIATTEGFYPIAVGFVGSAFGLMRIDEDWKTVAIEGNPRAGKSCLGMASVFLGCKTFDEFITLASQGMSDNVDYGTADVGAEAASGGDKEDQTGFYKVISEQSVNYLCWAWGKTPGKNIDDFRREDLAAALLRYYCLDLAMCIDKSMHDHRHLDIKHVFLGGGFLDNDVTRSKLTRELTARAARSYVYKSRPLYRVHFLRHGPYLGTLGSLLHAAREGAKVTTVPNL